MQTWSAPTKNYTAIEEMINCLQSNLNIPGSFIAPSLKRVLNHLEEDFTSSAAVFNTHLPSFTIFKRLMPHNVSKKGKKEDALSELVGLNLETHLNWKNIPFSLY